MLKTTGVVLLISGMAFWSGVTIIDRNKQISRQNLKKVMGLSTKDHLNIRSANNVKLTQKQQAAQFQKRFQEYANMKQYQFVNAAGNSQIQTIVGKALSELRADDPMTKKMCEAATGVVSSVGASIILKAVNNNSFTLAVAGFLRKCGIYSCDSFIKVTYNTVLLELMSNFFIQTQILKDQGKYMSQFESIKFAQTILQSPARDYFVQAIQTCWRTSTWPQLGQQKTSQLQRQMLADTKMTMANVYVLMKTYLPQIFEKNDFCLDVRTIALAAMKSSSASQSAQLIERLLKANLNYANLGQAQKIQWGLRIAEAAKKPENIFVPTQNSEITQKIKQIVSKRIQERKVREADLNSKSESARFMVQLTETVITPIQGIKLYTKYLAASALGLTIISGIVSLSALGVKNFAQVAWKLASNPRQNYKKTKKFLSGVVDKAAKLLRIKTNDPQKKKRQQERVAQGQEPYQPSSDSPPQPPQPEEEKPFEMEPYKYRFGDFSRFAVSAQRIYSKKKDKIEKVIKQALQSHMRRIKIVLRIQKAIRTQTQKNLKQIKQIIKATSVAQCKIAFEDPVNYFIRYVWFDFRNSAKKTQSSLRLVLQEFIKFLFKASEYFMVEGKIMKRNQIKYNDFVHRQNQTYIPLNVSEHVYLKSSTQQITYNMNGIFQKCSQVVKLTQTQKQYIMKFVTAFCIQKKFIVAQNEIKDKLDKAIDQMGKKFQQKLNTR